MSYIGTTEIGKMFLGDVEIDKAGDTALEGEDLIMTVFTFHTIQSIEEEDENA